MKKKHLLAAAAALSMAGAAMAQSSVTLFGIVDTGAGYGRGSLTSLKRLNSAGGNATSRLGFRGTEDLGGGLAASFWLEAAVNVDDGTGGATNTNNQPSGATPAGVFTFGRRATVSLESRRLGELRLGRDFTAHYRNRVETDPFGNVGVGTIQPQIGTLGGVTSTRASNMIGYFLPSGLGGLYGQAQAYAGEGGSGGSGGSVRLGWRGGPVSVSAALGHTGYVTTATTGDIRVANLGAIIDVNGSKLMAGYFRDRVASTVPVVGKGFTLGGIAVVGVGEVKAAYSDYGTDAGAKPRTRKLSLGYVHNLSKRTALYATAAHVRNSGSATAALNGATTAANEPSTGFDLGLRHSF